MEISLVGMLDISPNTKFEQPRVAGKHLMRHVNNDYAAVFYYVSFTTVVAREGCDITVNINISHWKNLSHLIS